MPRDSPDNLRPTTTVGLSDDSIPGPNIRKHFFSWIEGGSGRLRAMMSPKPTLAEALADDAAGQARQDSTKGMAPSSYEGLTHRHPSS